MPAELTVIQLPVFEPTMPGPLHEKVTPVAEPAQIEAVVEVQVSVAPEPHCKLGVLKSLVTAMEQLCVQPLEVLVAVTV